MLVRRRYFRGPNSILNPELLLHSLPENENQMLSISEEKSCTRDFYNDFYSICSTQQSTSGIVPADPDTVLRYSVDDTGAERGDQLLPIFGVEKVLRSFRHSAALVCVGVCSKSWFASRLSGSSLHH